MHRPPARWSLPAITMALALSRTALSAQPTATIEGRVVHARSGSAIQGAEVVLLPDGRRVITDSAGRYALRSTPTGAQRLTVRALGFQPVELTVTLHPGDHLRPTIELTSAASVDAAQPLAPVAVEAAASADGYRLVDFERRRRTGRGQYVTDDEIRRSGASRLQDLMRGMRGVAQHCAGTGCRIQMVRARLGCEPDYVVDGRPDNMFGASTPIRDIVALEVYTGPSDVPGEFAGKSAGCGVVVIWTRAAPSAPKP